MKQRERVLFTRLAIGGILALSLGACGKFSDSTFAEAPSPKPKHPWDWIPEDTSLKLGRTIYMAECNFCHNEGEEGAPSLLDREEWAERSTKGEALLIRRAIDGFIGEDGEMLARGGTESLKDDEVAAAVKYMLATQQQ